MLTCCLNPPNTTTTLRQTPLCLRVPVSSPLLPMPHLHLNLINSPKLLTCCVSSVSLNCLLVFILTNDHFTRAVCKYLLSMMSLKFRAKEKNKYFSRLTQSVADHQNLQVVTIKDVPSKQNSLSMSVLFLIETGFDQVGTSLFFFLLSSRQVEDNKIKSQSVRAKSSIKSSFCDLSCSDASLC